ncbi:voltage-gated potassium channel [Mucor ambiguus]|uniref:Voltage-gated potassium channel n=1 Tax=Mucor ambiguus TaxID=91626 RepID=A0A0C9M3I1_9FUNG|nr:voltage-gated potassium channel [Mucor ambiguus]
MGFFRSKGGGGSHSYSKQEYEETEPLHNGETIEMAEPGSSSSVTSSDEHASGNGNGHQPPLYRKLGRLAEEGWTSVANLVVHPPQPQPQPRSSTHMDIEDSAPPMPEIKNDIKRKLYLLLEEPASSRSAFWTNVIVSFFILFSAITTTIETIPSFRSAKSNRVWFHLESAMVALFTLEYLLRMFAHSDSFRMLKKFFLSPLSIIDFISIIPFYIEVIAKHDTTYEFRFTILRLFRLLRLFKSYKYSNTIVMTIEVMMMAFRRSGDALSALFFFTVTCVVLFSTLLYFAERGIWDETLQAFVASDGVPSIPAAFWFVLVTITTTGYGDMVPTTFIGKLITFPAMMFGVLLIALPSIIVGRNFTIVWESMRRRQFSNRMGLNPMGGGDDVLQSAERENANTVPFESPATTSAPARSDGTFGLLPNNGEDEILGQIQALMQITLQNQAAINKIVSALEKQGTKLSPSTAEDSPLSTTSYNKGKSPLLSKEDNDPFAD